MKRSVRRSRQVTFDALERRETPSAVTPSAVHHPHHGHHARSVEITGTGHATLDGTTVVISGGQSRELGNFTGSITKSGGTLQGADGSIHVLGTTESVGKPHHGRESVHGAFTITGGALGSTDLTGGSGSYTGTLTESTGVLSFSLKARATE